MKINGRSILLSYYTIDVNDEETYLKAIKDAYEEYGDNLLCFITSLAYLFYLFPLSLSY